mgnify:CR=1 FL=1
MCVWGGGCKQKRTILRRYSEKPKKKGGGCGLGFFVKKIVIHCSFTFLKLGCILSNICLKLDPISSRGNRRYVTPLALLLGTRWPPFHRPISRLLSRKLCRWGYCEKTIQVGSKQIWGDRQDYKIPSVLRKRCVINLYVRWSDGMQCCSDWPGLCLSCCFNPFCCQPTEIIWGFLFHKLLSNYTPLLVAWLLFACWTLYWFSTFGQRPSQFFPSRGAQFLWRQHETLLL